MTKFHVIKRSSLPARSPLPFSIIMWLLLDRLDAPGWIWGALGVVLAISWTIAIDRWLTDSDADAPGFGERRK